ncbi:MAG: arsenite methyltransferase [Planctomycetes bacterium]|nr:arsenite methyltransferase [Planctomycetota bacterium]
MTQHQTVRDAVSKAYASAVTAPQDRPRGCCSGAVQKGVVVKLAGYSKEELDALPPEAVVNSFGCGNPLALSKVKEGDVVLDLGSGAGIDVLLAGKKVGATGKAIGVDMTDAMLAKANENIAASGLTNVEVRKGTIEEMPVDSASVDWVISNCVINLSPDKPKVFSEIARVLKPGGRMIVSDLVVKDLPPWVREDQAMYNSCISGAIDEDEYLAGLRDAGLVDVEVCERIVYDATQLTGLIESELPGQAAAIECCASAAGLGSIADVAKSLAGKVWSAKFHATKPNA